MKSLLSVFALLYALTLASSALGQGDSSVQQKLVNQVVEYQKRIESIAAYKLHAKVNYVDLNFPSNSVKMEVWVESRGEKIFIQLERQYPKGSKYEILQSQIAQVVKSDMKVSYIFDGKQSIEHSPSKLQVEIEQKSEPVWPPGIESLIPSSWTGFDGAPQLGKFTFRYFLTKLKDELEFETSSDGALQISRTNKTDQRVGFKTRVIEIDPKTSLIKSSKAFGGFGIPIDLSFKWSMAGEMPFASSGNAVRQNTSSVEWEIDQFTTDPREVRTSFSLDESKLPVGTRIDTDPFNTQNRRAIRFVGGFEGNREYDLKMESLRLIVSNLGLTD